MKLINAWTAEHEVAVYVTDLEPGVAAHYYIGQRQIEISRDLNPDQVKRAMEQMVADGRDRCEGCRREGAEHRVVVRVA